MCRWSYACSRCCSANQPVQGIFSGYRRMACFAPGVGKHKMHVPEFLASTMYAAMCTMTHSFRLNHVARVHARTVLRAAATAERLPTRASTTWSILWHPWCRRSLRTRGLPSHICECNAGRMAHFSPITRLAVLSKGHANCRWVQLRRRHQKQARRLVLDAQWMHGRMEWPTPK